MILHEEQIIITKTVVPPERVTLTTHRITYERDVSVNLRTEHVSIDDHDTPGRG